ALAHKYFVVISRDNPEGGLAKASQFIQQLEYPENRQIRELANTPLLLNLACSIFQAKASFPAQHAKLYEEGLEILLVKWDRSKGVIRDEAYQNLSLVHKIKLLNQVGAKTFATEDYLFEQSQIQQHIADYLCQLPDTEKDPVALQINSEAVLKSIERQHGLLVERSRRIYSFSHLTFQEYFTAKHITTTNDGDRNPALAQLATHITRKHWREIFLLAAGMLRQPDDLMWLMKQEIDRILSHDQKLQQFIESIQNKSPSISTKYKPVAVRAFLFSLALNLEEYLKIAINPDSTKSNFWDKSDLKLPHCLPLPLALDPNFALHRDLGFNLNLQYYDIYQMPGLKFFHILDTTVNCASQLNLALVPQELKELHKSLQKLKLPITPQSGNPEQIKTWWIKNQAKWTEELMAILRKYYHNSQNWNFNPAQTRSLWQYYEASQLLVECLNSSYELKPEARSRLEEQLLRL
ncbi:MAG TPA: histidine kinase, partial [Cyanobacteria bacterium UBA11159]|nr:histidine kinase [Cyanobacteria bacterium UBA11159]